MPDSKMRMRRRAVRALMSHTQNAIRDLRNDEDEMLRGRAQPFGGQEASHLRNAAEISSNDAVVHAPGYSDRMPVRFMVISCALLILTTPLQV